MQALINLISEAKQNAAGDEFNPDQIPNMDMIDVTKFGKAEMLVMFAHFKTYKDWGYEAYLGKDTTPELLEQAVVSVKYTKKERGGRKYSGGYGFEVEINQDLLDTSYKGTGIRTHLVILTPRKYRGKPMHWLMTNVFDARRKNK